MCSRRCHLYTLGLLVMLVLVTGCVSFDRSGVREDAGNAGGDAAEGVDATPCFWSPTPLHFDPCALEVGPAADLDLAGQAGATYVYDTTAGTLLDPTGAVIDHVNALLEDRAPSVRVWYAESITVGREATLRVLGAHPLLIASDSTLTVQGTIDAGSYRTRGTGAGANPVDCTARAPLSGETGAEGGGGGGGGGFGAPGGAGGAAFADTNPVAGGAGGGTADVPENIQGGCAGARGGSTTPGVGGDGGGALHLAARTAISIGGVLLAGGAGGQGAPGDNDGGGGGGSGGYLGLEAIDIALLDGAILAANGGGGGEGQGNNIAGISGDDGQPDDQSARGGNGGVNGDGGDGGNGGASASASGQPGADGADDGGGGGGGGVGFIVTRGQVAIPASVTVSPAPTAR